MVERLQEGIDLASRENFVDKVIRDGMEEGHKWAIENGTDTQSETERYEMTNRLWVADTFVVEGELSLDDASRLVRHFMEVYPENLEHLKERLLASSSLQKLSYMLEDSVDVP